MNYTMNLKALMGAALLLGGIPAAQAAANKVLYIRAIFPDKQMTISDTVWQDRLTTLNTRLDGYWKLHSYQTVSSVEGTYTQKFNLPLPLASYFDVQVLRTAMRNQATNAGFNLSTYNQVVYSYPSIPHNINFGALGSFGNIWLPGENPFDGGFIHEFGHALGVGHANSIEGAAGVVFPGARKDGRDGLHMMGSDSLNRIGDYSTINLPMRYKMNFINDSYVPRIITDSTVRIWEYELTTLPSTRNMGARVDVNGDDFWISFGPKMVDRWANFNSAGFANGVIVQRLVGSITDMLDFTPGSAGGTGNESDYVDTRDGALLVGQSYTFPNSSVTIRPLATGTSGGLRYIDVEIETGVTGFTGTAADIGNVATTGSTSVSNGTYTMTASGADIWNNADSFHYYSTPTGTANGEMRALVNAPSNTNPWAKAGVMLRESNAANSKHVSVFIRPDGQVAMQWRTGTGTSSGWASPLRGGSGSQKWVRIVKTGNQATGYYSLDGEDWTAIQTITISLGSTPRMGLALTSHNNGTNSTATFTNVLGFSGVSNAEVFKYDFGTGSSPLESGYTRITSTTQTGPAFWANSLGSRQDRDRGTGSVIERDFVFGITSGAIFRHPISNGTWEISWTTGDPVSMHDQMAVKAEGVTRMSGFTTALGEYATRSFTTEVSDGVLDLEFFDGGGSNTAWVVNGLVFTKVGDPVSGGSATFSFDFGTPTSPLEAGYQRVSENTGSGSFRWTNTSSLASRDRSQGSDLDRDLVFSSQPRTFVADVPNGTYQVTVTLGDYAARHDNMAIKAEGNTVKTGITREIGILQDEVFTVTVSDGTMDLEFSDGGGSDVNWVVNRVFLQQQ